MKRKYEFLLNKIHGILVKFREEIRKTSPKVKFIVSSAFAVVTACIPFPYGLVVVPFAIIWFYYSLLYKPTYRYMGHGSIKIQ